MKNVTDINRRAKLARMLHELGPQNQKNDKPKQHIILALICFSLIGTMLPFQMVVTFFSLASVTALALSLLLFWKNQIHFSKTANLTIAVLLLASIVSGCSPALLSHTSPEMLELIREREYQYHTMEKYSLFGLGMDKVSIENVQFEGDIETVYVAKIEHGYGIVSLSRVTVAGK